MYTLDFTLIPFQRSFFDIQLSGQFQLADYKIILQFIWHDPKSVIRWPSIHPAPGIRDHLWKETCCELFLACDDAQDYWEYNFSPSGHWNCYHHSEYRSNSQSQTKGISTAIQTKHHGETTTIDIVSGTPPRADLNELQINICAIAKTNTDKVHYALQHYTDKPDFHHRKAFVRYRQG